MLFDVNDDIEVARWTGGETGFTFVAQLEPRPVVDPRRNTY